MKKTQKYRDQHDTILDALTGIEKFISVGKFDGAAVAVSQLAGKVKLHLAVEDKSLYPSLVSHQDKSVSDLAKKFQNEMGPLAGVFVNFVEKWKTDSSISAAASEFKTEATTVIKALRDRIDRENSQLYVAYDKVG